MSSIVSICSSLLLAFAMSVLTQWQSASPALADERDASRCASVQFISYVNGTGLYSESGYSFSAGDEVTFSGKTRVACSWRPHFSQPLLDCVNETNSRYRQMVELFPESKSTSFEKAWIDFDHNMSLLLGIDAVVYGVLDDQFVDVDVSFMRQAFPNRFGKNDSENAEWFRGFIAMVNNQAQQMCALDQFKDSDFAEQIQQYN